MSAKWLEKTVKLSDLKPFERNPRKISKDAYKRLKDAIMRVGYHQRILATPDLRVIGGHQRIKALKELGHTKIRVLVPNEPIAEDEFRRLLIEDNLQFGEFDLDIMREDYTIPELCDFGFPKDDISWGDEIPDNADDVPEIAQVAISKPGDIWLLGNHRLMCGDSTKADEVNALLDGVKPHLMVTDPPYGVEYDADWRNHAGLGRSARAIGKVQNDDRADWTEAFALFPGNIAYIWHGSLHTDIVKNSIEIHGFKIRALIIWAKSHFAIGRGDYHAQHEPCWYAVKGNGNWCGDRKQTTLWQIDKPQKSETGHSTQKPVECMKRPIENNSSPGQAIYEPFSGSGTTIIAGEITDRHICAMEISPLYVDMAVKRWQNYTGRKATLLGTGAEFEDAA